MAQSKVQVEVRMQKNKIVSRPLGKRHEGFMALIARKSRILSGRLSDRESWKTLFAHKNFKTIAFHCGVVIFCLLYIAFGATIFYKIERPLELNYVYKLNDRLIEQNANLLLKAEELKEKANNSQTDKFNKCGISLLGSLENRWDS
ncbi:hypothetical protein M3Y97_00725600 [Aphelenchoides bicaudatus]|nr:hypothetical protein M3Y97_00725600 [Aphelenchoides bicaudatus]